MGVDFMAGYKDMCQGRDGLIHLTGTYGSGTGNGDNPVISFSEQWLREGSCLDVSAWGVNTTGMVAADCPDDDSLPPLGVDGAAGHVRAVREPPLHLTAAPNPFNPAVRLIIPPGLHRPSLKIYNFAGALVEDLPFPPATDRTVVWNAAGHPSGLYFAVLQIHGKRLTRTLVLAK
jgi:hypothetical protein